MELKKLTIEGFGKHRKTEFEPNNLNLFFGENGSGKSSIKDAFYHLLTGDCMREDFINHEDKKCVLVGDFGNFKIRRKNTPSSMGIGTLDLFDKDDKAVKGTMNNTEKQQYIYDYFRVTEDQIKALFYSQDFIERDSDEQLNLISQFLKIQITTVDVAGCLRENVRPVFLKTVGDDIGGQDIIDNCYKKAFDTRKDAGRIFKLITKDIEKGFVSGLPEGVKPENKAEMEALLTELEGARAKLYERKGRAKAMDGLDVDQLNTVVADNTAFLDKHKPEVYQADVDKCQEYIKKHQEGEALMTQKINGIKESAHGLLAKMEEKKSLLMQLESFNGRCPVFKGLDVECGIKPDEAKKALMKDMASISGPHEKLEKEIENLERNSKSKYNLVSVRERIEKDKEFIRKIQIAQDEVKRAEKNLETSGEGEDVAVLDTEVEELEDRIRKGRNMIERIVQEKTNIEHHKELEAKFTLAKRDHVQWDTIVKDLDVEKIKNKLLNRQVLEFRNKIRKYIEDYSSLKVDFDFSKKFKVLVDGFGRADMSKGQRQMFNVAFQCALAGYMGIPFLIVDDVDMFDYKSCNRISEFFVHATKKFDTILAFVAMRSDILPKPSSEKPYLNVYLVDDGKLEAIK